MDGRTRIGICESLGWHPCDMTARSRHCMYFYLQTSHNCIFNENKSTRFEGVVDGLTSLHAATSQDHVDVNGRMGWWV